jgi:hypothetical protein
VSPEGREVGERVLVVGSHHGRGRTSGVGVVWSIPYRYAVRDGNIARVECYRDRTAPLKAVRLVD